MAVAKKAINDKENVSMTRDLSSLAGVAVYWEELGRSIAIAGELHKALIANDIAVWGAKLGGELLIENELIVIHTAMTDIECGYKAVKIRDHRLHKLDIAEGGKRITYTDGGMILYPSKDGSMDWDAVIAYIKG